jgi:hypothetical protein
MNQGPVEYLLIAFPGSRFRGDLLPALAELKAAGTIRILDLAVVQKAGDGTVATVDVDTLPHHVQSLAADVVVEDQGLISQADIELAAETIDPGSTAGLLIWENVWLAEVADAIEGAGGQVIMDQRLPADMVAQALSEWSTTRT